MKETAQMVAAMTVFCLVSGLLLAWTDKATRAPIAAARMAEKMDALKQVMPASDNDLLADAKTVVSAGRDWTIYVGRQQGRFVGAAFESEAAGYGGPIRIMAGVKADGELTQVVILDAGRETPGLGSKIKDPEFLSKAFGGRRATPARWAAVRKDGGEIEAVTGATISSRAVARAVREGLEAYAAGETALRSGPEAGAAAP